jgi:quercetin dioxygenase-like cupin family protein
MRFAILSMLLLVGVQAQVIAPVPSPDPGVKPIRLMDRAEIRVTRVELAPGAVRSVHEHQDAKYHVWVALEGKLEITVGSAPPIQASLNQAVFMQRGTKHGFRNLGTTPGAAMEIFVKDGSAEDLAAVLAAAGR